MDKKSKRKNTKERGLKPASKQREEVLKRLFTVDLCQCLESFHEGHFESFHFFVMQGKTFHHLIHWLGGVICESGIEIRGGFETSFSRTQRP